MLVRRASGRASQRCGVSSEPNRLPRVLITGASGFVGTHLCALLVSGGFEVRRAVRSAAPSDDGSYVAIGEIGPGTSWKAALSGVDVVVHLAARVHILRETAEDPRREFMRVNAEGTEALVRAAVNAGVTRLIYLSSIGVHGCGSDRVPLTDRSPLQPHDLYTQSKLAGEMAARSAAGTALELVVLRPPLIYGSNVKANFLRLMRWIDQGLPLPLGAVRNRRSLVNVWNLCDLLLLLLDHPAAPKRPWLVSDGEDLSTAELAHRIGASMGRTVRLFSLPEPVLRAGGALLGRRTEVASLCNSLRVDMTATRGDLCWQPPIAVDEAVARTVDWYLRMSLGLEGCRGATDPHLRHHAEWGWHSRARGLTCQKAKTTIR